MAPEKKGSLLQEVEFQAKKKGLSNILASLADLSEVIYSNLSRKYTPTIYFTDGDEVFGLSFEQIQRSPDSFNRTLLIELVSDSYSEIKEVPDYIPFGYDPPIHIIVLNENPQGKITGIERESIDTIEGLNQAIGVALFIRDRLGQAEGTSSHPIVEIPEVLKGLVEEVRKNQDLQYEKRGAVFFEALRRVGQKTKEVRVAQSRFEDRDARIVIATTDWVEVEQEGRKFWLRLDGVQRFWNGDWTSSCEVLRSNSAGSEGELLFNSFDITRRYKPSWVRITTPEEVQECINTLGLLDKSLQTLVK